MYRQKLIVLLLLAGLARADGLPLISNEAKHCLKPNICATVSVSSIASPDPALNAYADNLMNGPDDTATAKTYRFDKWDKAGLEAWIRRVAREELSADEEPNNDYTFDYVVSQVGESAHYRVLDFNLNTYTGGAHGMSSSRFYVLPKAGELKAVALEDILLPNQRAKLDALQQQAFTRWLKTDEAGGMGPMDDEGVKEHFETFPFTANANWRPDKKGLLFRYDPYEIGPYAMGMPEVLVPTAELKDVVKPEILAELDSWQNQQPGEAVAKPQWRD